MSRCVAIVTGVSTGLGLQLASAMATDHNLDVVGVSRSRPQDSTWGRLEMAGSVEYVQGDVSDPGTVELAFARAREHGSIDYVVNCAGMGIFGPLGSYTRQDIDDALASNLIGTILFSQEAFKTMHERGGAIINVMSTSAHVGRSLESVYCASKWGARGFTESLRVEAKGTPVDVVAVYPGGMRTPFWDNARGTDRDGALFMDPHVVARAVLDAVISQRDLLVSDIVINRKDPVLSC